MGYINVRCFTVLLPTFTSIVLITHTYHVPQLPLQLLPWLLLTS